MKFIYPLKLKKLVFPVIGIAALIWFLIRVIPKPSRASYPCMRASAPLASSMVLYLIGLLASTFFYTKAKEYFRQSKYMLFVGALLISLILGASTYISDARKAYAVTQTKLEEPNSPMGQGVGVCPGRVAWVYDPASTNEDCTNEGGDYWFDDANTDQAVVNKMFSDGLKLVTKATTDAAAWDSIFHYYNRTHGRGDVGYTAGEKIAIKVNYNAGGGGPGINTSPHMSYTLLNHLINTCSIAQADIGIGDPHGSTASETYNKCHAAFPNVKFWGSLPTATTQPLSTSDGVKTIYLPQAYLDATYMINMPVLKKHHRAGISLCSKNHFGSCVNSLGGSAFPVHYSLPCPDANGEASNGSYGSYRIFVDFMGCKNLGGKTILYVIDGLWSSVNYAHPPVKWHMMPFNNDWPSSIFMSQDPVAIESVGFDFLYKEFDENHPTEGGTPDGDKGPFPHFAGVDDFLHQAADPINWPSDITYAPNGDGIAMKSMGTHEHWNNDINKCYSRNLGFDKGIELVSNAAVVGIKDAKKAGEEFKNYPNPFSSFTTIHYYLKNSSNVRLVIYDVNGKEIQTLLNQYQFAGAHNIPWNINNDLQKGIYFGKLTTSIGNTSNTQIIKIVRSR